jgi:hypothetical protein
MSTYVRQDGHAAARIAGDAGCGDRLRFPAEEDDDEVDADDVDVAGEAVVLPAAARSRAERTMSRVQTAAELVVGAAGAATAAGGGRLRSWCPPCTLGWRGVRNVLPDCEKKINKGWVEYTLQKKYVLETIFHEDIAKQNLL